MKDGKVEDIHDVDANLQDVVSRVGGRFKLTALIQKKLR
ncbi:unnamed protein product, partial [marine sediment metagenome]